MKARGHQTGALADKARPALISWLVVVWAILAPDQAAWSNPVDAFGFGARSAAMAGAQTAASDDGGANYYNPAILATFDEIRFDLGYQLASPSLTVNDLDVGVAPSRGVTTSLNVPGRIAGTRVALGAGLFLPDQHITRTRTLASSKPRFVVYDNRPQRLFIAANLSLAITERLFIGGGLAYMSSTRGSVLLDGRIGFPSAEDSDLDLAIDVDLETIRYPQAGLFYRATPWLDIALSYRGGFTLTLDQLFTVRGDVGLEGREPVVENGLFELQTVSQDLFQPTQVSVGAWARISRSFAVAFDLQWQRWSEFENPAARVDIMLDAGQFNDLIDIPDAPSLPRADFHDIVVPRVGVEWTVSRAPGRDVHLRTGYGFELSPVPAQFGESNFIDNHKHNLSLGAGLVLHDLGAILLEPLSLDAYVALTVLGGRDHVKLSPIDPVGDYRSDGHILQAGVSSRWRF